MFFLYRSTCQQSNLLGTNEPSAGYATPESMAPHKGSLQDRSLPRRGVASIQAPALYMSRSDHNCNGCLPALSLVLTLVYGARAAFADLSLRYKKESSSSESLSANQARTRKERKNPPPSDPLDSLAQRNLTHRDDVLYGRPSSRSLSKKKKPNQPFP